MSSLFFDSAQRRLAETFKYIFGEKRESLMAVKTKSLFNIYIKPFGWLNSLYVLAEKGIFNKEGLNGIDSVKNTNLYKVMTYLSWISAKNEYESKVTEKISNSNKMEVK